MPIHEGSDSHRSAGFTYSLDNSSREAPARFDALSGMFDRGTILHLEDRGVSESWRCLEVGEEVEARSLRGSRIEWDPRDTSSLRTSIRGFWSLCRRKTSRCESTILLLTHCQTQLLISFMPGWY